MWWRLMKTLSTPRSENETRDPREWMSEIGEGR
jgi:hypothetical protein